MALAGSLGIALAPALAEAASSGAPAAQTVTAARGVSAFVKAGFKPIDSPASNSVRVVRHSAATTTTTTPNPDLGISVGGGNTSAYGVSLDLQPSGLTMGTAKITVNWGDSSANTVQTATTKTTELPVSHEYARLGAYTITVTIDDGAGDVATNTVENFETAGSLYTAYGPTRILDTREGLGATQAPVKSDGVLKLDVVGAGPAGDTLPSGITAVVMNVTVTEGTTNGVLTVYGDQDLYGNPESTPNTSNLNYRADQNVANQVVVPVGANGMVDFYNNSKGTVHVVADVAGYFTSSNSGDKYVPITPARILDTRYGTGAPKAQIPANGDLKLTVDGSDNHVIPASGVTAVALNLTAVDSTAFGLITAYPAGESLPTVSNLNYAAGQTVANMATVPVGTNGQIILHNNSSKPVDLIADAAGYYTSEAVTGASAYVAYPQPIRVLDTRQTNDSGGVIPSGPISSGVPIGLPFDQNAWQTAFVFNATVVSPTGNGFLSLYSYDPAKPNALPTTSNLNYGRGQTIPNLAIVMPGTVEDTAWGSYDLGIYLGGGGSAQLILDEFGQFDAQ